MKQLYGQNVMLFGDKIENYLPTPYTYSTPCEIEIDRENEM